MCDKVHYDQLDERVTNLESTVNELRRDTQAGFSSVTNAVNALGHDFGERMNSMDKRLVEEKQKWGETIRNIVKWTVRAVLGIVTYAAGVNLTKDLIPQILN